MHDSKLSLLHLSLATEHDACSKAHALLSSADDDPHHALAASHSRIAAVHRDLADAHDEAAKVAKAMIGPHPAMGPAAVADAPTDSGNRVVARGGDAFFKSVDGGSAEDLSKLDPKFRSLIA